MPHIIIEGNLSPEDLALAFQAASFAEGGNRFKAEEIFLARDKESVLIRSLTIERGFTKNFFVRASRRGSGISLTLEKIGQPDTSEAVKRILGLYAWVILQSAPDARVSTTDIGDFIGEPRG
ncbi:hypothetical protein IT570_06550 [Candidatus Sumerlaeota bacterium]|nr:hypothetical protein [Candidatus Sumerlaeota bacterium]